MRYLCQNVTSAGNPVPKEAVGRGTVSGIAMRSPKGPECEGHLDLLSWERCLAPGVSPCWHMAIAFISSG